jgi:O-antigen/teichoic acid export membrane protein
LFGRLLNRFGGSSARRISGALLEQAVFSGGNFVLNVILARELPGEQYGAFVVAYTWFLMFQNYFDAFVVEPFAINGGGKYREVLSKYMGFLVESYPIVAIVASLFLFGGTLVTFQFDTAMVGQAMLGASIGVALLLLRWLTRQHFVITGQMYTYSLGSLVNFIVTLIVIFLFSRAGILSAFSAIIAMGIGSVISSLIMIFGVIRPDFHYHDGINPAQIRREHWAYGRWSGPSKLANWVSVFILYLLLPQLAGLTETGALRAIYNVAQPLHLALTALAGLMLPILARILVTGNLEELEGRVKRFSAILLGITLLFLVGLVLFGSFVINFLYDGAFDQYISIPFLIALGMYSVVTAPQIIYDTALRAIGGVQQTFYSNLLPAILTPILGILLYRLFGLTGIMIANSIVTFTVFLTVYTFYRRRLRMLKAQRT